MIPLRRARWIALLSSIMLIACAPQVPEREIALPAAATITHRAVLIGKGGYEAMGTVILYKVSDPAATFVVFEDNFTSSAPPHTVVALGRKGIEDMKTIAPLRRRRGRQVYQVPLAVEVFDRIWLWDRQGGTPVALARLVQS